MGKLGRFWYFMSSFSSIGRGDEEDLFLFSEVFNSFYKMFIHNLSKGRKSVNTVNIMCGISYFTSIVPCMLGWIAQ